MTSSVNSSRSTSPIPMNNSADDTTEGQSAAGSSSMPSQTASAPHPSTLSASRRGSAAFLVTQPEHAATSSSAVTDDPNALNYQGNRPLIQAFHDGNLQEFKRLLADDRVDINRLDEHHRSPLLVACMGRSDFGIGPAKTQIFVEELLKKTGIHVNAADRDGITPLHMACRLNALGVVKALLRADGIDVNPKDNDGKTPLDFAFDAGNEEIMTALFEHGGVEVHERDEQSRTLLQRLLDNRFTKAIPALLALAPELASRGDNSGRTPLHQAAVMGVTDIVRVLLEKEGVNVNAIDEKKCTPLHHAAMKGRSATVVALLEQEGVNVNAIDTQKRTPLHHAVWNGHTDAVKALLEKEGININPADKDGSTPLHFAAGTNRVPIGKLLLARDDLDLSVKGREGITAFYMAVDRSPLLATEMLKVPYELDENGMLAENALRPDEADVDEITPLNVALQHAMQIADFERLSLFRELLNDPRVDPNQLQGLLRVSQMLPWETVFHNLATLGFEGSLDSLFEVLHQWANKKPVGVRQNQALAAKTNFYLGQLYHLGGRHWDGLSDDEELKLQSRAVFHHALALEQLMKHPEQSERQWGLDHTETVDGIDSILNYARTLLDAVSVEDLMRSSKTEPPAQVIWNNRTKAFPLYFPATHAGHQRLPKFDLIECTIVDDVAPTEAINIGGNCVPLADIEDLANGRGHKAMQLGLAADQRVELERNVHQIGHLMTGAMMLDAVRNKNAEALARLNDASSSAAEAQPHAVPDFAVAAEQVRAAIARTHKRRPLNDTQSEVTQARRMRLADAAAAIDMIANMPAGGAVNQRELSATVQDVFREMWFYIQNSPDDMRKNLEDAFFGQVADMWDKSSPNPTFFCATGCVQRLLSVPHYIDPSLMTSTRNLSPQEMSGALGDFAKGVLRPIRMAYNLAGIPEILDEDAHLDVEREIFEATAREVMIGFRGWEDSPKVHEAIEAVKKNLEYIDMVAEDTQET